MEITGSLWASVQAHLDTELYPATSATAISTFEAESGIQLPSAHREFFMRANGGVVGYSRLFGVNLSNALDLKFQMSEMREDIEAMADGPILPFASDWGGSYFCYDLSNHEQSHDYPVLYWNHEYAEEPDDLPMVWEKFATNFVGFLNRVIAF